MSAIFSMPIREAVFAERGNWRLRTDRIWGVVIEVREEGKSNTWDCWTLDTIGL